MEEDTGQKETIRNVHRTASVKRGRFLVETASPSKEDWSVVLELMEKQNEQIEILFDMVKNISGEDRLFHKEYQKCSTDALEILERLRKIYRLRQ